MASSSRPKVTVSPNTDAVSASVSGVVWWKIPCSRARYACRPWPISCASVSTSRRRDGPVEQQVRVLARHGVRAERARPLARADRRVDPRLVEEPLRRPTPSSGENDAYASSTSSRASFHPNSSSTRRHRRHAVVVGELVEPEQPAPSASTTAAGCRSAPAPRRRAPDRLVARLVARGSGSRSSSA